MRRLPAGISLLVVAALWAGLPAGAHVQGQQLEAPAGGLADLVFRVEHGCDSSPTVAVAMQLPDGVTEVVPVAPDGWTVAIEGDVIRWAGGALPADTPGDFSFTARMPDDEGSTLYLPFVQTCVDGELAWIEIPTPGGAEPSHPAPAVEIVEGQGANAETTATTLEPSAITSISTSTTIGPTITTVPFATATTLPGDGEGQSGVAVWLGLGLGAAVVVAAGIVWRVRHPR